MMTQEQKDQFRLALSSCNSYTVESIADLDIDEIIQDESQIVVTRETIEDFFKSRGFKTDRHGNKPNPPREQNETLLGLVYCWENQQSQKGKRRGTLYVMDFGEFRAAYFDGEA